MEQEATGTANNGHEILAEIPRNRTRTLRVTKSEFKGRTNIHLRLWYLDTEGELRPGKEGFTLTPEQLPELRKALQAAERALKEAA